MNAMTQTAQFTSAAPAYDVKSSRLALKARSKALAERADDLEEQCRTLSFLAETCDSELFAEIDRLSSMAEALERQRAEVAMALARTIDDRTH